MAKTRSTARKSYVTIVYDEQAPIPEEQIYAVFRGKKAQAIQRFIRVELDNMRDDFRREGKKFTLADEREEASSIRSTYTFLQAQVE